MSTAAQTYPGGVAGGGLAHGGGHAQSLTEEPAHGPGPTPVDPPSASAA